MRDKTILRDPVHGYVQLSPAELALLGRPVVQRLHRITQNGLAYLTYPSNRTSRFAHSVGAMHIAGNMFRSAIVSGHEAAESPSATVSLFRGALLAECEAKNLTDWDHKDLVTQAADSLGTELGFRDPVLVTAWQSVRLACLLHDLGHLPFSHTSELVLRALLQRSPEIASGIGKLHLRLKNQHKLLEQRALHEMIGVELSLAALKPSAEELQDSHVNVLLQQSLGLARLILLESTKGGGALAALHRLIDGEVDADRADYVLRDALTSGIAEVGNYDLDRIIQCTELDNQPDGFNFRATAKALHAVEGFCLARFRMWRALVFHNNVVRSELALSRFFYLFGRFQRDDFGAPPAALKKLRSSEVRSLWGIFSGDEKKPLSLTAFLALDEALMFAEMRRLLDDLGEFAGAESTELKEMLVYLSFILDRDKRRIRPLWKHVDEYCEFAASYSAALPAKTEGDQTLPVVRMHRHLRECIGKGVSKEEDPIGTARNLEKLIAKHPSGGREGAAIRLAFHMDFKPDLGNYKLVRSTGGPAPVKELSSIFEATAEAWGADVQFHAFEILLAGNVLEPTKATPRNRTDLAVPLVRSVEELKNSSGI
ncbi:MAG: HD domain-containing protein [Planctomycetes bacterium]|nr:HD domain-containing protein [Planctomycetota bacterium]